MHRINMPAMCMLSNLLIDHKIYLLPPLAIHPTEMANFDFLRTPQLHICALPLSVLYYINSSSLLILQLFQLFTWGKYL